MSWRPQCRRRMVRSVLALVMLAAGLLVGSASSAAAGPAAARRRMLHLEPRPLPGRFRQRRDPASGENLRLSGKRRSHRCRRRVRPGHQGSPHSLPAGVRTAGRAASANAATYNKIYELQDDDCSPIHFTFGELNNCNSDWSGGAVSAAQAKSNALRTMWKLEAMRHALGDKPLRVTSGFRSKACNDAGGRRSVQPPSVRRRGRSRRRIPLPVHARQGGA